MAIVSPLRARRNANRPVESTQQVIMFCLRHHWFALPMAVVKRVSSFKSSNSNEQIAFTDSAEDAALVVINADQTIFLDARSALDSQAASQALDHFLIVFQTSSGETYGLTVSGAPKMQRISPASIAPFSLDLTLEPMQCISSVVNQTNDPQMLYLLNPEQLCHNAPSQT
jgi:chemotaxis signal transduction protein